MRVYVFDRGNPKRLLGTLPQPSLDAQQGQRIYMAIWQPWTCVCWDRQPCRPYFEHHSVDVVEFTVSRRCRSLSRGWRGEFLSVLETDVGLSWLERLDGWRPPTVGEDEYFRKAYS